MIWRRPFLFGNGETRPPSIAPSGREAFRARRVSRARDDHPAERLGHAETHQDLAEEIGCRELWMSEAGPDATLGDRGPATERGAQSSRFPRSPARARLL